MACEKDEIPMLSDSHPRSLDENVDSHFRRSVPWTRSASLSIDMPSMDSHERETNLVGHTGPLISHRTPFVPMSGPLSSNHRADNVIFRPSPNGKQQKEAAPTPRMEKFPSMTNGMNQNDWTNDNFSKKNDHLLRSGQLGMCNDPYCTTCPSYYHYKPFQQKHRMSSGLFDPHVCFSLNIVQFYFCYSLLFFSFFLLKYIEIQILGYSFLFILKKKKTLQSMHLLSKFQFLVLCHLLETHLLWLSKTPKTTSLLNCIRNKDLLTLPCHKIHCLLYETGKMRHV